MYKRDPDGKKKLDRMTKLLIRNWIICFVSLGLAIFCYFFFLK